MPPKRVKIVSNGLPNGTHVYDADTGIEIKGIRSITWEISLNKPSTANIEFVLSELDVEDALVEITGLGDDYSIFHKKDTKDVQP